MAALGQPHQDLAMMDRAKTCARAEKAMIAQMGERQGPPIATGRTHRCHCALEEARAADCILAASGPPLARRPDRLPDRGGMAAPGGLLVPEGAYDRQHGAFRRRARKPGLAPSSQKV